MKKIACLFVNVIMPENNDIYSEDDFFTPNALNSFKKWNPDIDVHFISNKNFNEYCDLLQITESYEDVGLFRILVVKKLMEIQKYEKIIILGIDTITCDKLNELIDNNYDDIICSSGGFHTIETEYFKTPIVNFNDNGKIYTDIPNINGDLICFNNVKSIDTLYNTTLNFWTSQREQGGLMYCYLNQKELGLKVSIVDYPYYKTPFLYNIRSKGVVGGYCMIRGNVLNGRKGKVISDTYPTSLFYIKNDKLFTIDHKQVKLFHFCEGLGCKKIHKELGLDEELTYEEQVNEMKTMWFNKETIDFLKKQCNCSF